MDISIPSVIKPEHHFKWFPRAKAGCPCALGVNETGFKPMKDFFIEHCAAHENQTITTSFVVAGKQVKPKKNGEPYLALTLADRTGQIEAKMWDGVPEAIDSFEQDDFVKVRGLLNKYNGRFQLTVHKIRTLLPIHMGAELRAEVGTPERLSTRRSVRASNATRSTTSEMISGTRTGRGRRFVHASCFVISIPRSTDSG